MDITDIISAFNFFKFSDIYLEMEVWKHSCYRDEHRKAIDIHPSPTKYGTNWITSFKLWSWSVIIKQEFSRSFSCLNQL